MPLPAADQIRQLSAGGSVTLPQRPLRLVGGILGAFAFTAFGVFMIVLGLREVIAGRFQAGIVGILVIGVAAVAFFGGFVMISLIRTTVRPRRLVLTAEWFREEERRKGQWRKLGSQIPWCEIRTVSIVRTAMPRWPFKGLPMLAYELTDGGVTRIHREASARRTGQQVKVPQRRAVMRNVFGSARQLDAIFGAAHREFGSPGPGRRMSPR